jgi:hypothetical protein
LLLAEGFRAELPALEELTARAFASDASLLD